MQEINQTLARAQIYGVAALAFTYPEDVMLESIRSSVATIAEQLQIIGADGETIEKALAFVSAGAATTTPDVQRNYDDLFSGRKQCSLDESEYDKSIFYRQQRIADVSGFYRAFGFEMSPEAYQRPDFVGTELEFMNLLLLKKAYALEQEWPEHVESCSDAEEKFIREHLEWWIPLMCENLRGASSCAFYRSLSNFLKSFIRREASRYFQPA